MAKVYESTLKAKKKWERENYDALGVRVKKVNEIELKPLQKVKAKA